VTDPVSLPAVVLAAGSATRFGSAKQTAPFDGEALVRRATRAAQAAGAAPVIVVVGAHADAVRATVSDLEDVIVIENERWATGLASSVTAGIQAARRSAPGATGVLLLAADQPLVDAAALRRLLNAFPGAHGAAAAAYDGVLGVPAAIGIDHLDEVGQGAGDRGAGTWLRANAAIVVAVECAAAAHDVDTPDDLMRAAAMLTGAIRPDRSSSTN